MYKDLVKRLREESEIERWLQPHSANETPKLLDDAADAIEELSSAGSIYGKAWTLGYDAGRDENMPHWIPVTERLPELYEDVQILFPNNQAAGFYDGCGWYIYTGDVWYSIVDDEEVKPTHWAKKLPDPPKEEWV